MVPQNTANLWTTLCEDLQTQRQTGGTTRHHSAADAFVKAAKEVFGSRPQRLAEALEIAGDVHHSAGGVEQAKISYEEALTIATEQNQTPVCLRILMKLGALYEGIGDWNGAKNTYRQGIEFTQAAHYASMLPSLLNNLSSVENHMGRFSDAERHYQRSIDIAITIHGQHHPEVATLLNNFAVFLLEQSNDVRAENLHLQALSIRERNHGSNHPDVARSLYNLAVVFQSRGDFSKSKSYYDSAIFTFKRFVDADDKELQMMLKNYNSLMRS